MSDSFYTPEPLATQLLAAARVRQPSRAADFAVGAGSLLAAVRRRWPDTTLYGVDLNSAAISETLMLLPDAFTYQGDFLSSETLGKLEHLRGTLDVVALNPPFSCRGAATVEVDFEGLEVRVSKAMAFILKSCQFISNTGEVLAIVPRSCLFSDKDSAARVALRSRYVVEDLGILKRPGFRKASVSVHLVRVSLKRPIVSGSSNSVSLPRLRPRRDYGVEIMRGNYSVSDSVLGGVGSNIIHTTDLFRSQISINRRVAARPTRAVTGTVIMLPRVGRPDKNKVAIGTFLKPVVPSECVICVKTRPEGHEAHLMEQIVRFWKLLENSYSGTCAPYITMKAFGNFLSDLGYDVRASRDIMIWNPQDATEQAFEPKPDEKGAF